MKRPLLFFILLALIIIPGSSALQAGSPEAQHIPSNILFFPFDNYTGSDMKYLTDYIPELLVKNFKSSSGIIPVEWKGITGSSNPDQIKTVSHHDPAYALELMKSAGAEYGIAGRYLVQDKTIVIESAVVKASDGKFIQCPSYEVTADERLFSSLSSFAINRDEWIRINLLHENPLADMDFKHDAATGFVQMLKSAGLSFIKKGWSLAVIIMIGFYILAMTASTLIIKLITGISSRTETEADDAIISLSRKPLKFIIVLLGIRVGLYASDVKSEAMLFVNEIITSLILLSFAFIASGIMGVLIRSWGKRVADRLNPRINNDLVPLFDRTVKVIIFSVVIMLILSRFHVDVAPLVASLGIAGFAVGFAVKDTLSNIIGGIILILDNSFSVGDKVTIDDDTGFIKEVGLRNTKILTFDNEIIVIPNGELMNKKFKNYVLPDPTLRIVVNFSAAYGSNVDYVREVVLTAISSMDGLCFEPLPVVEFVEMGDFSLNFLAKFWIPDFSEYNDKKLEATDLIYKALNKNNIDIPFPTNTVYLKNG